MRSVAGLGALREELLAQTMTASDVEQRRISESIHDGPLQDILAVRQELVELDAALPGDERIGHALVGLQLASQHLRQATFELHPAVLERVGLRAAVQQLAAYAAERSGIQISADIDYPIRSAIDPIMFGVVRELLSNIVRHSRARSASVTLGITDGTCVLHVVDDGVGFSAHTVVRRLGEGHIGLASHRARVEAARGAFVFLEAPVGTHACVELPLNSEPDPACSKLPALRVVVGLLGKHVRASGAQRNLGWGGRNAHCGRPDGDIAPAGCGALVGGRPISGKGRKVHRIHQGLEQVIDVGAARMAGGWVPNGRASLGNSFPIFERSVPLVVVADDQAVAGVKLLVFEQH